MPRFHYHRSLSESIPVGTIPAPKKKQLSSSILLIDLRGNIPCFCPYSNGKMHDGQVARIIYPSSRGPSYVMDRGLHRFRPPLPISNAHGLPSFTAGKKRTSSLGAPKKSPCGQKPPDYVCDQTIVLTGTNTAEEYPQSLRRVKYVDPDPPASVLCFLTNNFVARRG